MKLTVARGFLPLHRGLRFHTFFGHFSRVFLLVVFRIWRGPRSSLESETYSTFPDIAGSITLM